MTTPPLPQPIPPKYYRLIDAVREFAERKPQIDVFYKSPKGASVGKCFTSIADMDAFVSKLHKPAVIMCNGVHVGRVWRDGPRRWQWFYDPELIGVRSIDPVSEVPRVNESK